MDAILPELTLHIHKILQQNGIFSLLSAMECPHIEGVWGGGSAAVLAAVVKENPEKNIVVLTPTQKIAQDFQDDFALFSARPTLFFPWMADSVQDITSSEEETPDDVLSTYIPDVTVGERLRVLKALAETSESSGTSESSESSETTETHSGPARIPPIVVAPVQSLLMPGPSPETLLKESLLLKQGETVPMEKITEWLVTHGFQNTTAVEFPGEFFARGGLIDIYAVDCEKPLRIEFFGDEIDSIREFDPESQRSLTARDSVRICAFTSMLASESDRAPFTSYLTVENTIFYLLSPDEIQLQGRRFYQSQENPERLFTTEEVFRNVLKFPFLSASALGSGTFGETFHIPMESVERFSGDFGKVKDELDRFGLGQTVFILCPSDAEISRLATIFEDTLLARKNALKFRIGMISEGFRVISSREMVLSSSSLFHREEIRRSAIENKNRSASKNGSGSGSGPVSKAIDAFSELREGDYVVHVSFGIARYHGLKLLEPLKNRRDSHSTYSAADRNEHGGGNAVGSTIGNAVGSTIGSTIGSTVGNTVGNTIGNTVGSNIGSTGNVPNAGGAEEHMVLEFRDAVYVYVPVSKIALVQKYISTGGTAPRLSTYGGKVWERMKQAVADSVKDLASEMLDVQAMRMSRPGIAFPVNTPLQQEFDSLFPYSETPDQLLAMEAIHSDMSSSRPMDRLLCGDVGFGKTEMAMRAAFTAVEAGYQVAIMVPTTVLADQHLRTFSQRMATFPIHIESISRFSSPAEQKLTLERLEQGKIDIIVGTHRLASADIKFHNLGLVIIDEEQRFGVEMKEALKRLRTTVDVLTMTATPIPRTLHMSLLGIRDISSLETPPADRRAIETHVTRFQDSLVRNAIMREIDRSGQIFFIHNRVYDIEDVANRLRTLVPEARIAVGHAQMPERELERVMMEFIHHDVDILLSTTIVESGLDIPNANTIFIDEANRYGLAELHQLRGRVGRFKNHAYCYLLVKENASLTDTATRRLKAIEEFAHLGSGFSIAMRDLEIRGAGNILGTVQSGQIAVVGYELYCDLLETAVRRLRHVPPRETVDVDVNLPVSAYIPHQYVPDMRLKMDLYRRLSRMTRLEHVKDFAAELEDRFGKIPPQAQRLLKLYEVRILAHQWLIYAIHREENFLVFEYYSKKALEPLALRKVGSEGKKLRFADEQSAYLPLDEETANAAPDSEKMLNYVEMLLHE